MPQTRSPKSKRPKESPARGKGARRAPPSRGGSLRGASLRETSDTPEIQRVPQQDRGQRRVDSILDAAESVFAESGVDAATTQQIAERAGASMGSIYHFFPGKDAILLALAKRYADRMRDVNAAAMPLESVSLPVETLFERIIWGHVRFIDATPAFGVVTEATTRKYGHCSTSDELDAAIVSQVRAFIDLRLPKLSAERRAAATRLSVTVVGEVVDSTVQLAPAERETVLRELHAMLVRYFAPLDREFGLAARKR